MNRMPWWPLIARLGLYSFIVGNLVGRVPGFVVVVTIVALFEAAWGIVAIHRADRQRLETSEALRKADALITCMYALQTGRSLSADAAELDAAKARGEARRKHEAS